MVGEDAVSVYTQLLMKFVDLLAKIGEEKRQNKLRKPPKIPTGNFRMKLQMCGLSALLQATAEKKACSSPTTMA